MEISTLIEQLDAKYAELFDWLESYPEADLNIEKMEGKWTAGQHLEHLIKSTKPLNKAMRLPKLALRTMFGKNNRDERTFEALVEKYQKALQNLNLDPKVAAKFAGSAEVLTKAALKNTLKKELESLKKILLKWKEKDLSTYLIPHPAIGKLTVREMMYFTIYHTGHHLKQLKKRY